MIVFILQILFLIVTATLGRQDVGQSLSEWPHHQWPQTSFQSNDRANSELSRKIQDIEDNLICYIYNICHANRIIQIPIVSQYIYDASDETLLKFIEYVETVYGKQFTEPISEEAYIEKMIEGPNFYLKLKNFMDSLSEYFFEHGLELVFPEKGTIYDTKSLKLTADLYGRYFANATQRKESEARIDELFDLHKKNGGQEDKSIFSFDDTIYEIPEKRDEVVADIKHMCGLLLGYIFNSVSTHFREICNKFDEFNVNGAIWRLLIFQNHLRSTFEKIIEKQLEIQGRYDPEEDSSLMEWLLKMEINLRIIWNMKLGKFNGVKYRQEDDEYTRDQLRTRIHYFAKLVPNADFRESEDKMVKLLLAAAADLHSTSALFNDFPFPRQNNTIQEIVDLIAIGGSENSMEAIRKKILALRLKQKLLENLKNKRKTQQQDHTYEKLRRISENY